MYHLTCLRGASNPCVPSRTEGFHHGLKDLHWFSLKHYSGLSRWWPGRNLRVGPLHITNQFRHATRGFGWIWQRFWLKNSVLQLGRSAQIRAIKFWFQYNSFRLRRLPHWCEKMDGQSELDYREGASLYPDFFDLYFYFVLILIWIYFVYYRKANYVQECSWFRVIDAGKQDGFNFFWLLWFMIYSLDFSWTSYFSPSALASAGGTNSDLASPQFAQNCVPTILYSYKHFKIKLYNVYNVLYTSYDVL